MTKGIFSIVTVFILFTSTVVAWEQIKCIAPINKDKKKHWTTKLFKPVIDPISIPEGSPQYKAILEAIEQMNLNPSNFRYDFGGMDNPDGVAENNGESEIWMQDLGDNFTKNSAIESSNSEYSPTCTATESDIIINTHYRMARPPAHINKLISSHEKKSIICLWR